MLPRIIEADLRPEDPDAYAAEYQGVNVIFVRGGLPQQARLDAIRKVMREQRRRYPRLAAATALTAAWMRGLPGQHLTGWRNPGAPHIAALAAAGAAAVAGTALVIIPSGGVPAAHPATVPPRPAATAPAATAAPAPRGASRRQAPRHKMPGQAMALKNSAQAPAGGQVTVKGPVPPVLPHTSLPVPLPSATVTVPVPLPSPTVPVPSPTVSVPPPPSPSPSATGKVCIKWKVILGVSVCIRWGV
jgi:hypothetical protein